MEDGADIRRGAPSVAVTGRHGSSWPDMHHTLGSNNFASGSGSSSGSSKVQYAEEANKSRRRACVQEFGKGLECSRPAVVKSSSVSTKLLVSRSGGQRVNASGSHSVSSVQGQWNALQGLSGSVDRSGLCNMDTDTGLGLGLNSRLGLPEVPAFVGTRRTGSSQGYSLGRTGISAGNNSDSYPGRISGHSSSMADYSLGRLNGQVADKRVDRSSTSSGLPLASRLTGLTSSDVCQLQGNAVVDEAIVDLSLGDSATSSFLMEREGRDDQALLHHGRSSSKARSDSLVACGSNSLSLMGDEAPCSSDSHFFQSSATSERDQMRDIHSLKGSCLPVSLSNSPASYNDITSSPRGSACKRKSCTSGLPGSSSCRSGSPHSGFREGNGIRLAGGSSTGRRSSNLSCISASDVVASASAVAAGRCAETSVGALDEPCTRKSSTTRDGGFATSGRQSKILSTVGTSVPRGTGGHSDHFISSQTQSTFGRDLRRANSALQLDTCCSRYDSLAERSIDADLITAGLGTLARSTDQLLSPGGACRSNSPLVPNIRTGSTSSPRRVSSTLGERLSHRYVSRNRSGMSNTSGAVGSFGGIGNESRVRARHHSSSSSADLNSLGNCGTQSRTSSNTPGVSHSGSTSGSSPSRQPSNPASVRYSQNPGSLHVPMLSSPTSAPAPSRLPPPPPSSTSSLSSAFEMLPSGFDIFQSSLLPRSSPSMNEQSDRALGSAAESLLGLPFQGLQLSDREHQPRLVAEGLAEILLALERVERDEDLTYEQLLMLEATLLFGGMGLHDQHSDLRLDVDNMSYEELLALEERIGNVNTGLAIDKVNQQLKKIVYSSQTAAISGSQESDIKCTICQEEYEEGDELGKIDCGHNYHMVCIKQWLVQKNQCPICKAPGLS